MLICIVFFFCCCSFIQCGLFNGTCHWCRKLGTTLLALKARRMLEVKVTAFGFFFISAIKAGFCSAVNSTLSFQILSATLHTLLRVVGPSMSGQFEYVSHIHYARLKSNIRFYCHYVMYMYNSVSAWCYAAWCCSAAAFSLKSTHASHSSSQWSMRNHWESLGAIVIIILFTRQILSFQNVRWMSFNFIANGFVCEHEDTEIPSY